MMKALVIFAHPDDAEGSCGGTTAKWVREGKTIHYLVITNGDKGTDDPSMTSVRLAGIREKEQEAAAKVLGVSDVTFLRVPDGELENSLLLRREIVRLIRRHQPDIIFTHYRNDLHQDHRLISDLTWNTFRNHLILEYEVPKYDGGLGSPNYFVHLSEDMLKKKVEMVLDYFETQRRNHWFTGDTFLSMLRIRGLESNAPSRYAEGFYCRKMIF